MKVAFLDTVHPVLQRRLEQAGMECVDMTHFSVDEIQTQITSYGGIVIRSRIPMNKEFLDHAKSLKWIARSGAGMENIDIEYCKERGIELHNAPEGNRQAVAEHALGMLLSLMNNLLPGDKEVRSGKWDREGNRGVELSGKTVGIIGYGNNGSAFARVLAGFDVQVLAYDKYKGGFGSGHVKESTHEEIFEKADVISFHIPLTEETQFMVDEDFIGGFEKPVWLLNLSRGKVLKTEALVEALKSGKVLGAGLDVLEYESKSFEGWLNDKANLPNAFKYLTQADNVILSSHVGGWTVESYFKLSNVLADKILA